ncbi:unnamed protein product, partial [Gongylonema pulchrum]|uniref:C2H2-type domain-containing protein n=1 Tax=Gongylonema pulchrum TaxID=637853 RepID=A0A183CZ21_9BILA
QRAAATAASKTGRISAAQKAGSRVDRVRAVNPSTSRTASGCEQNDGEALECRLCRKMLESRIRGFHILWHMSKDFGVNRYACKFCDFGHDRSLSVTNHGKKEHGVDDCVEDRIEDYSDVVKKVSELCFGLQSTFAQDNRKKSKSSDKTGNDDGINEDAKTDEEKLSTTLSVDDNDLRMPSANEINELPRPPRPRSEPQPRASTNYSRDRARKSKSRRFGFRQLSRVKRREAAKLREISLMLGGSQYVKRRQSSEAALCQGNQLRDLVVKHIRDVHSSCRHPIDERMKYRVQIKEIIRQCYPSYFVDAPIPSDSAIEKLMRSIAKESELHESVFGQITGGQVENAPELEGPLSLDDDVLDHRIYETDEAQEYFAESSFAGRCIKGEADGISTLQVCPSNGLRLTELTIIILVVKNRFFLLFVRKK